MSVVSPEELVERIAADLHALGVKPGDCLLVHSSFKSLGPVEGGPETVIRGLLLALGDAGTLMMPALSYETVSSRQPLFDPVWTRSCVGAIPEYFRTRKGTRRSVHPTHSVCAVGSRAEDLLAGHEQDRTPVGPNSPFARLPGAGGKILMLGCGLRPNTSMHGVEELHRPAYLLLPGCVTYVLCGPGGQQVVEHRRHDFRGYAQRYDRIEPLMQQGLTRGKVLAARSFLFDAKQMWSVASQAICAAPFYFVEQLPVAG